MFTTIKKVLWPPEHLLLTQAKGRRRRRRVLRVDRLPNNYDVTEFLSTHSAYRIERIDFSPNSVDLRFFRPVDAGRT